MGRDLSAELGKAFTARVGWFFGWRYEAAAGFGEPAPHR